MADADPFRTRVSVVLGAMAILVALAELAFAGHLVAATTSDSSDDPLVGGGYIYAGIIGLPGLVGLVLGLTALALRRSLGGLVLAVLAVAASLAILATLGPSHLRL